MGNRIQWCFLAAAGPSSTPESINSLKAKMVCCCSNPKKGEDLEFICVNGDINRRDLGHWIKCCFLAVTGPSPTPEFVDSPKAKLGVLACQMCCCGNPKKQEGLVSKCANRDINRRDLGHRIRHCFLAAAGPSPTPESVDFPKVKLGVPAHWMCCCSNPKKQEGLAFKCAAMGKLTKGI